MMGLEMLEKFAEWRALIGSFLDEIKRDRLVLYKSVHQIGPDALERLIAFCMRGKMIRGGLVCFGHTLFAGDLPQDTIAAGGVLELFHSALLIHDDIMDRDTYRRGKLSLFSQYKKIAGDSGVAESGHLGESLGICVGDIAFFLAFELLSEIEGKSNKVSKLVLQSARELSFVGIAQMADVIRGATSALIDADTPVGAILGNVSNEAETINIYRYKTGRYTFSLPLMVGATLAGCDDRALFTLEKLGESLGILFQLKDDEIGLFGNPDETGKPIGSDVREGKKTLFYHYLVAHANDKERKKIEEIYGNPATGEDEVSYAIDLLAKYSIREQIGSRAEEYAKKARAICESLDNLHVGGRELLEDLVAYSTSRTR